MGKYSLENYCVYETYKIRPKPLASNPDNKGRGMYQTLEYTWEELEPERGRFCIDHMTEELRKTENPILKIVPSAPSWFHNYELLQEGFSCLLRKVGSVVVHIQNLVGVIINSSPINIRVLEAYINTFESKSLLVRLEEEELITYLKENKVAFGLVVNCNEENWIDCCERFARLGIQNTWEQNPVVLEIEGQAVGHNIQRESVRWHASLANLPMEIGYCFTLRRLTFPKKIIGCGGLPLRFWFVNTGSAPCYMQYYLKIKLSQGDVVHEFLLNIDTKQWLLGDIVHNEIISLPGLQEGVYKVSMGIFFLDGSPMKLSVKENQDNGFYELGLIEVDDRLENNLLHAWDDFYPDGYYPLEDPQEPKES